MRLIAFALLAATPVLVAQAPPLTLPEASPRATVSQTVGLTDIDVSYHRPAVNGRKIWGGLVPYGQVWRAGANENTVVTFSSPVRVGGTPLPAGRYGLHMLPTATAWTVIFSSQSHGWGSYSYDAKGAEALRAKALTKATEVEVNQLGYTLLGQKKMDEALALFQRNVQDHPDSWNAYDSLAEAYALKGDKAQAAANYRKALERVKQADQRTRIQGELDKLK